MTGNDYTDEDWLNDYDINYLHSKLTEGIIKIYYEVYNTLGFGFLEQVYQNALYFALMKEGYTCKAQYPIDVYFEDQLVGQYKRISSSMTPSFLSLRHARPSQVPM